MFFNQIHLVGVGGTGSYLAAPLVRFFSHHKEGGGTFYFWDKDIVEHKNLERQHFGGNAVGHNKATVLASSLATLDKSIIAKNEWFTPESLHEVLTETQPDNVLVVLAVDNDATRNRIINYLEDTHVSLNFCLVLPGNSYETANTFWYGRQNGVSGPVHPFEVAENWRIPEDNMPGGCSEETASFPQLISANFASALMAFKVVEALLNDQPIPFKLEYSGPDFLIQPTGKPWWFQ